MITTRRLALFLCTLFACSSFQPMQAIMERHKFEKKREALGELQKKLEDAGVINAGSVVSRIDVTILQNKRQKDPLKREFVPLHEILHAVRTAQDMLNQDAGLDVGDWDTFEEALDEIKDLLNDIQKDVSDGDLDDVNLVDDLKGLLFEAQVSKKKCEKNLSQMMRYLAAMKVNPKKNSNGYVDNDLIEALRELYKDIDKLRNDEKWIKIESHGKEITIAQLKKATGTWTNAKKYLNKREKKLLEQRKKIKKYKDQIGSYANILVNKVTTMLQAMEVISFDRKEVESLLTELSAVNSDGSAVEQKRGRFSKNSEYKSVSGFLKHVAEPLGQELDTAYAEKTEARAAAKGPDRIKAMKTADTKVTKLDKKRITVKKDFDKLLAKKVRTLKSRIKKYPDLRDAPEDDYHKYVLSRVADIEIALRDRRRHPKADTDLQKKAIIKLGASDGDISMYRSAKESRDRAEAAWKRNSDAIHGDQEREMNFSETVTDSDEARSLALRDREDRRHDLASQAALTAYDAGRENIGTDKFKRHVKINWSTRGKKAKRTLNIKLHKEQSINELNKRLAALKRTGWSDTTGIESRITAFDASTPSVNIVTATRLLETEEDKAYTADAEARNRILKDDMAALYPERGDGPAGPEEMSRQRANARRWRYERNTYHDTHHGDDDYSEMSITDWRNRGGTAELAHQRHENRLRMHRPEIGERNSRRRDAVTARIGYGKKRRRDAQERLQASSAADERAIAASREQYEAEAGDSAWDDSRFRALPGDAKPGRWERLKSWRNKRKNDSTTYTSASTRTSAPPAPAVDHVEHMVDNPMRLVSDDTRRSRALSRSSSMSSMTADGHDGETVSGPGSGGGGGY